MTRRSPISPPPSALTLSSYKRHSDSLKQPLKTTGRSFGLKKTHVTPEEGSRTKFPVCYGLGFCQAPSGLRKPDLHLEATLSALPVTLAHFGSSSGSVGDCPLGLGQNAIFRSFQPPSQDPSPLLPPDPTVILQLGFKGGGSVGQSRPWPGSGRPGAPQELPLEDRVRQGPQPLCHPPPSLSPSSVLIRPAHSCHLQPTPRAAETNLLSH